MNELNKQISKNEFSKLNPGMIEALSNLLVSLYDDNDVNHKAMDDFRFRMTFDNIKKVTLTMNENYETSQSLIKESHSLQSKIHLINDNLSLGTLLDPNWNVEQYRADVSEWYNLLAIIEEKCKKLFIKTEMWRNSLKQLPIKEINFIGMDK